MYDQSAWLAKGFLHALGSVAVALDLASHTAKFLLRLNVPPPPELKSQSSLKFKVYSTR